MEGREDVERQVGGEGEEVRVREEEVRVREEGGRESMVWDIYHWVQKEKRDIKVVVFKVIIFE